MIEERLNAALASSIKVRVSLEFLVRFVHRIVCQVHVMIGLRQDG